MIISIDGGGVSWDEGERDNGREVSINHLGGVWGEHIYYVAIDTKTNFRSAGVVENLIGITNLMYYALGKDWNATGLIEG